MLAQKNTQADTHKHADSKERESYNVRSGIGFGEKSGSSEIATTEGFLILENIEVVVILVLKN